MSTPLSRREFLSQATAAAAATSLLSHRAYAAESASTGNRLRIAIVGAGGRGANAVEGLAAENIVALCDVDEVRCAKSREAVPGAKFFHDYRVMFEQMAGEIDAVAVATPDHMHFPIAMMALKHGKHLFVEKPLTHSIWEARELRKAAAKAGVATQMGNQGHANEGTRLMREWVQAGVLGAVREVHHWTNRPIWPQNLKRPDHSKFIPVVPDTLKWDLWLGVAPDRPYDPAYPPFNWRGWWDFGTGALGDMGCHVMDAAFWALDLDAPEWVEATSTSFNGECAPNASIVTYQFPARGALPPVRVTWSDGDMKPALPVALPADFRFPESGTLLIGDKNMLVSDTYNASVRLVPEEAMKGFMTRPEKTIPRVPGGKHFDEWVAACKGGPKAGSNFDYSTRLTETVLLGNVAIRARHRIMWDAKNLRITNDEAANQYLRRAYRPGWGV